MNQLYHGDNLQVLREHIADESVDVIYLDPPFNSKRDYTLLFNSPPPRGNLSSMTSHTRAGQGGPALVWLVLRRDR